LDRTSVAAPLIAFIKWHKNDDMAMTSLEVGVTEEAWSKGASR
jgi:hypothetical protein